MAKRKQIAALILLALVLVAWGSTETEDASYCQQSSCLVR